MPSIFISSHCSWLAKQLWRAERLEGWPVGQAKAEGDEDKPSARRRKISRKIISIYLIFCCICLALPSTLTNVFYIFFLLLLPHLGGLFRSWPSPIAAGPNFICRLTSCCCCGAVETLPKRRCPRHCNISWQISYRPKERRAEYPLYPCSWDLLPVPVEHK